MDNDRSSFEDGIIGEHVPGTRLLVGVYPAARVARAKPGYNKFRRRRSLLGEE